MRKSGSIVLVSMIVAAFLGVSAQAQVMQPTNVLSAGGSAASGPGYSQHATLGQPIVGSLTHASYAGGVGFWVQVVGPPDSPPNIVTRYVAPAGNDAGNDCTNPAAPCATLAHAVAQANDGDTIDMAAGTYTEPGVLIEKKVLIQGQGVIVW